MIKRTKVKNKWVYLLIAILGIIAVLVYINVFTGNRLINDIYSSVASRLTVNSDCELYYFVYDNKDDNEIKALAIFASPSGIEYVIKPDGSIGNGYENTDLSLDFTASLDVPETFKIKTKNSSETPINVVITKEYIDQQFSIITQVPNEKYKVNNMFRLDTDKTFIKLGVDYSKNPWIEDNLNPWVEYKNDVIDSSVIRNASDLDTITNINASDTEGKIKFYLLKKDVAGNCLHTYTPIECNYTTNKTFVVFDRIKHLRKTIKEQFISPTPSDTLVIRHNTGVNYYDLYAADIGISKASSIYASISTGGNTGGSNYTITAYYTDGTYNSITSPDIRSWEWYYFEFKCR